MNRSQLESNFGDLLSQTLVLPHHQTNKSLFEFIKKFQENLMNSRKKPKISKKEGITSWNQNCCPKPQSLECFVI